MSARQHGAARRRAARRSGVVGILLITSLAIAWLAGALASPAAADHGGSHAAQGYFLADSGGHMTRFGDAMDTGSLLGSTLRAPIVDGDTTPSGKGSVLVASDGGVFAFGDAPFLGSMAGAPLAAPIFTIEMTPTGRGYLMAAADGGVFAFGDARFRGSLGGLRLNRPIVDMALNATNDGYLLAAADGGVFAFGQSRFRGSMGGRPLNKPIVGILPGEATGYGLVASDGGVFAFGGFVFRGSLGSLTLQAPIVDAVVSSTGDGYNMVASDGGVFAFGDAPFVGSLARLALPRPIVTILGLGNQPPEANGDAYTATEDTVLSRSAASGVLANDTDDDGDTLTAAVATAPTKGTLVLNADGSFTYTPNANANGADSFTYTVSDPHGKRDTATVSITINAVNDAPVAANDAHTTNEDTPLVVAAPGVLGNDSDIEGSALTATVVSGPSHGTLTLNANGSFSYTPNANTNGADSFTYRANDGTANSNVATVSLTINAVNDPPVAVDDVRATNEDTVLNVAAPGVLANDTDVEGSPLTAALVSGPSHGTLTLNANGSFSYTPNANTNGADSFTYRANDGTANSNVATVSLTINAVNDPPVAVDDTFATNEDTALNGNVLANDSDLDGNALSATVLAAPTHGALTLNPNGTFTYTPNAHYNGADSFTYTASDGNGGTDTAAVTITVNAVNDAPAAVNDAYATDEDTVLTVAAPGVLANDSDIEGSPMAAVLVTGPAKGTVTLGANGSFTYTPNANANGADSFTYKARDGAADSNVATVGLTINAVNDTPVAVNDSHSTNEDTPLTVAAPGVLGNDSDADGNALTAALVTGPSQGTLTLNSNGSFTYTPAANYAGPDSFTYRAHDGTANSNTATVTIAVNAVNDAPAAVNDAYATNEDTPLTVAAPGVLANDSDTEGSALTAVLVTVPTKGTLTLNSNGSFTYTPDANANGADSFTYKANDGAADSNVATVGITVNAINDAPVAVNDAYSTNEDTQLDVAAPGVLANDTDVEGPKSAVLVSGPAHGTLTLNANGSFAYMPTANYNGPDSFTYKVNDGAADSGVATVALTVNSVNDAPVAVNDAYSTNEDTPLTVTAPGVLVNDSDIESAVTAVLGSGPSHGTLTLNANGSFTYTPAANYAGADSFTYRASDGTTQSNLATVSLTVNGINDAPVAVNDSRTTNEDTVLNVAAPGVLGNDTDADGNPLTAVLVANPSNGSLTLNANGSFTYTPNANFNGSDSFTYKADDGPTESNVATVTITVTGVNDAPVAVDDAYATNEDTPLAVPAPGVLANDIDVEGPLSATSFGSAVNGTIAGNADGSFTFTPTANYSGPASFAYTVSDGTLTDTGTVTVTVSPVNDAPAAGNNNFLTNEDTPFTVTAPGVLANDTDAEGNSLTAVKLSDPTLGLLAFNSDGSFTYTPNANANGVDSFTYKANDGSADSNTATVFITVDAVNDPPVAVDDAGQTLQATPLAVTAPGVLGNDTDVEGDTLTAGGVSDPAHGSVTLQPTGAYVYTPDPTFTGADTFTYTADDDNGGTDTATVTITVLPPNTPPTAANKTGSGNEDAASPISITLSGEDVDGDALAFTAGTATNGLVTVPTGATCDGNVPNVCTATVSYTPSPDFNGADSFTYTVNDGTTDSAPATVTVTVTAVNDPPSFTKGGDQAVNEDAGAQTVSGWATAISDGPANESTQTTTFETVGTSNNALFSALPTVEADGDLTYTPAANVFGSATVTVRAKDNGGTGNGGSDTSANQQFDITVNSVNDAPVAVADAATTDEDTAEVVSVLANDTDADSGDTKKVTSVTQPAKGLVTITNGGADVTWSPDGDFDTMQVGDPGQTSTFSYTVQDAAAATSTATVTVTVTGVNDNPTATPKAHTAIGNTLLTVGDTSSAPHTETTGNQLLVGVTDPDDTSFTVSGPTSTVNGAVVAVDTDGSFTFLPGQGDTGDDTFTFTVHDAHGGTDTDTVTVSISNMVWYVNAAVAGPGTGRSSDPFDTPAPITTGGSADTKDGAGDHVFVYQGNYSSGLALETDQKLWGQPHGLTVAGTPLVTAGGANPTLTDASGHGIALANGVDVQRVNVGASGGFGLQGTSVTNATVGANTTVNDGVSLTGSAGGNITIASTITNGANPAVVVSNRSSGTVALSGNVTDTGAGISLTSNTGATINLTGQLSLTTTTNDAFTATAGGTVTAPHTGNAITTTGGRAINVSNATIGAADLVFRSVNVNAAGTASPANGIILNNTGPTGSLTILGTGSAASGGTIRATTGPAVSLASTRDVAFSHLKLQDSGDDGIVSNGVTNLTLTGVQVLGAGNGDNERALDLVNTAGTLIINGGTYDDASDDLVKVDNTNTNVTVTVSNGAVFSNQAQALAGNAFDLVPSGTTAMTASITGSTFNNLKNTSVNFGAANAGSSGASTLTFSGNAVNGGAQGGAGVAVSGQENTTTTVTVNGNTFTGAGGNGVVNHDVNDNSTVLATVTNNTFTSPKGHGIVAAVDENGDIRIRIAGNTITNAGGDGIEFVNFGDDSADAMTSTAHVTVTNNTISGHSQNPATQFVGGIGIFHFENDADTSCAKVTGNTVTGSNPGAGFYDIFLQDNTSSKLLFEESPNTAATGAVMPTYIQSLNAGTTVANIDNIGAQYSNGVTCTAP